MMNWKNLEQQEQLAEIDQLSAIKPVLIFKHSTRCSTSAMVLNRLERSEINLPTEANFYLDLIAHRDISNAIASRYGVVHESPQALIIRNGKAVYHASHFEISAEELGKTASVN